MNTEHEWQEGETIDGYTLLCKGIRQRRVAQAFAKHANAECWRWGANHFCVVRAAPNES